MVTVASIDDSYSSGFQYWSTDEGSGMTGVEVVMFMW